MERIEKVKNELINLGNIHCLNLEKEGMYHPDRIIFNVLSPIMSPIIADFISDNIERIIKIVDSADDKTETEK